MCYTVYIARSAPQQMGEFIPGVSTLYLQLPGDEELLALKDKFTLPYIYHVGTDTKCSCGLSFDSDFFDEDRKASLQALLNLLNELTTTNAVEFYCCWYDDWDAPAEHTRTLISRDIKLDENYFGLVEREFIRFERDGQQ